MYSLYYSTVARKLGFARTTDWGVAIRKVDSGYDTILGKGGRVPFTIIENTDNYWFADPLLFSDKEQTFLFVEAFNKKAKKGEIGCFDIVDGKAVDFKLLIETPTHMSYPFVFKYEGDFYMIPETGAARQIVLYRAKRFPEVWEVDSVLMEGDIYRDSTIVEGKDGNYIMLSYRQEGSNRFNMKNTLVVFQLNMNKKELTKVCSVEDPLKNNRPAGPLFRINNKTYRVSQKCNRAYGEAMYVYELYGDDTYKNDIRLNKFDGSNILLPNNEKVVLTHTYSQSGGYEVIDYRCII